MDLARWANAAVATVALVIVSAIIFGPSILMFLYWRWTYSVYVSNLVRHEYFTQSIARKKYWSKFLSVAAVFIGVFFLFTLVFTS